MSRLDDTKNALIKVNVMKMQTLMTTTQVKVECPHCGEQQDGFYSNPAGGQYECDHCKQSYLVDPEADIEFG